MSPDWTSLPLPSPVACLASTGPGLYAGLADGRVYQLAHGAEGPLVAWADGTPRALLAASDDVWVATETGIHRFTAGRLVRLRALPGVAYALHRTDDAVWAVTRRHGVFCSRDGGRRWAPANEGLPYHGTDLSLSGLAASRDRLFLAHALGVSVRAADRPHWGLAAPGLPLHPAPRALVHDGAHVLTDAGGRLFALHDGVWTEQHDQPAALLAAAAGVAYGLTPDRQLVRRPSSPGGRWAALEGGWPAAPIALAAEPGGLFVSLDSGRLLWRPVDPVAASGPPPAFRDLPPFWSGASVEVRLHLPRAMSLALALIRADGAEIARLVDGVFEAGLHRLTIRTEGLPSGLHRCRLSWGGAETSRPVAVL